MSYKNRKFKKKIVASKDAKKIFSKIYLFQNFGWSQNKMKFVEMPKEIFFEIINS